MRWVSLPPTSIGTFKKYFFLFISSAGIQPTKSKIQLNVHDSLRNASLFIFVYFILPWPSVTISNIVILFWIEATFGIPILTVIIMWHLWSSNQNRKSFVSAAPYSTDRQISLTALFVSEIFKYKSIALHRCFKQGSDAKGKFFPVDCYQEHEKE